MLSSATADVLSIARRGVLIAVGSGGLLAEASGRLLRRTAAASEQQVHAWRTPLRRTGGRLLGTERMR